MIWLLWVICVKYVDGWLDSDPQVVTLKKLLLALKSLLKIREGFVRIC